MRPFGFGIVAVLLGLCAPVLVLELVLRWLPVHDATRRLPVNAESPVLRYAPNRDLTWSKGWHFQMVNRVRINSEGFVNDLDYQSEGPRPLVAVIGDSYVEALMVPFEETGHGRLARALDGRGRVYSFAISGAPLSQYLAYAEYANRKFRPDAFVFVVVGNDFDQSLSAYNLTPGYHYFESDAAGQPRLRRVDFRVGWLKRLARRSALARYLVINLELPALPAKLRALAEGREVVADSWASAPEARVTRSKWAVDAFLDELPERSGRGAGEILFVLDGLRPHLYDEVALERARGSFAAILFRYFRSQALSRRYEVIDLGPVFLSRRDGTRFESPHDTHWNAAAHELFFKAMRDSAVLARFFPRSTITNP